MPPPQEDAFTRALGEVIGRAGRFVLLPKAGYSFAAWLQLEDGRGAAEQLASADTLLSQQAEHASAAAAAASAAAVASDQAVFALLHQQQPSGSHSFMLHHQQQSHLLHGVALAIRRPPPAGIGAAGSPRSPRESLQLVAHSWSPKHAEAVLPLQSPLVPGRWHHVALSHSAGAGGRLQRAYWRSTLWWSCMPGSSHEGRPIGHPLHKHSVPVYQPPFCRP